MNIKEFGSCILVDVAHSPETISCACHGIVCVVVDCKNPI